MDVKLLDFNGSKVLTYGQIAATAKTSVETLRVSFTRHKKDFVEGKDFIVLSGHDLRSFFDEHGNEMPEKIETTRKLYLWTRTGSRKLLSFLRSTKKQQAEEAVKVETESKKNEVVAADVVKVDSSNIQFLEYNGERVVTTKELAKMLECDKENIAKNFRIHVNEFFADEYYCLTGDELKQFKLSHIGFVGDKTAKLYLWNWKGAMHNAIFIRNERSWYVWKNAQKIFQEQNDTLLLDDGSDLIRVEYNGEFVLTTEQLAKVYDCSASCVSNNYRNNQKYFNEGIEFYCLKGEELRDFKRESDVIGVAKNCNLLYLWTERGASMHCKFVNTDRAKQWFRVLHEFYFAVKEGNYRVQDISKVDDKSNDAEEWKEIALQYLNSNQKLTNALLDINNHLKLMNERLMAFNETRSYYINKVEDETSSIKNAVDLLKEVDVSHIETKTNKNVAERIDDSKRLRLIKAIIDKSSSNDRTRQYYRGGYGLLYDVVSQKLGRDLINEFNIYKRTGSKNKIHYFVEDLGLSKILLETAQELFE